MPSLPTSKRPMPPRYIAVPFIGGGGVQVIQDPVLTATTVSGSQINLSVAYVSPPGAVSYSFEQATSNVGPFTTIASGTSTTFSVTGLLNATTYFFRARVQVVDGRFSQFSAIVSATTLNAILNAPTGVTATAQDANDVLVSWNAVAGATSYSMYQGGVLDTAGIVGTSFLDTGLLPNTTYTYNITTVNAAGESPLSASAQATTPALASSGTFKFNPGHYFALDVNTSLTTQIARAQQLKGLCPEIRGFEFWTFWGMLENPVLTNNSSGQQYDGSWGTGDQTLVANQRGFRLVDSILAACNAMGVQCGLHLYSADGGVSTPGTVSSTSWPTTFAPLYLSDSAFGPNTASTNGQWGGIYANSYPTSTVRFRYFYRYWDQRVMDRINLWHAAYGARYDLNPTLEVVSFLDESSLVPETGCTDANTSATMLGPNGAFAKWRAAFPHTQIRWWGNYLQTVSTMDSFLASCLTNKISVGGPDCANEICYIAPPYTASSLPPYRSVTADWRMRNLTAALQDGGTTSNVPNYVGVLGRHSIAEGEDLAWDYPNRTRVANSRNIGDGVALHIMNQANLTGTTHMYWFDNTFTGPDYNRTNTAHPNLIDFIRSCAQGGNVAVNGVTAGVKLNKTTPPSSW